MTKLNTGSIHHQALEKLISKVCEAGHSTEQVSTITLTSRFNGKTGNHIHATCSVKLRFDASVSESEMRQTTKAEYVN